MLCSWHTPAARYVMFQSDIFKTSVTCSRRADIVFHAVRYTRMHSACNLDTGMSYYIMYLLPATVSDAIPISPFMRLATNVGPESLTFYSY